jgi:LppP/LprE lipoprotein
MLVLIAASVGLGTVVLTMQGSSHPHIVVPAVSSTATPLGSSPTPPAPPGPYTTIEAAQQYIRDRGFNGPLTAILPEQTWRPDGILHVMRARWLGSADNPGDFYFFFVDGHPVGQLYLYLVRADSVIDNTTFSVTYERYTTNDAACCPSKGQQSVRLKWDGTSLTSLDPIIDAYQCYGVACLSMPFRSSKPSPPEQPAR